MVLDIHKSLNKDDLLEFVWNGFKFLTKINVLTNLILSLYFVFISNGMSYINLCWEKSKREKSILNRENIQNTGRWNYSAQASRQDSINGFLCLNPTPFFMEKGQ